MYNNSLLLTLVTTSLVFTSCSNSTFSSSSGASRNSDPSKSKNGKTDIGDESELKGPSDDGLDADGGSEAAGDDDDFGGEDDSANAGDIVSIDEAKCLKKKGDDFRILFAFDNSGSTTKTDPTNIRRTASMKLIDQFTDFVKANPTVDFRTTTVGFSGNAIAGANRWIDLSKSTRTKIESDIVAATTTSAGTGTNLMKGLNTTGDLLAEDNTSGTEKRQRNYVILLSDGLANGAGDSMTSLPLKMNELVANHGVAVYSIIVGKGSNVGNIRAMDLMTSLALPIDGAVGPDHVGTFVHAPDSAAIESAFADFFKKVTTGCE